MQLCYVLYRVILLSTKQLIRQQILRFRILRTDNLRYPFYLGKRYVSLTGNLQYVLKQGNRAMVYNYLTSKRTLKNAS